MPVRDGRRQWGGRAHENEGAPNSQQASSVQNRPFVERRRNRAGSAHSAPGQCEGPGEGGLRRGRSLKLTPPGQDPPAPWDRTHQPPRTGPASTRARTGPISPPGQDSHRGRCWEPAEPGRPGEQPPLVSTRRVSGRKAGRAREMFLCPSSKSLKKKKFFFHIKMNNRKNSSQSPYKVIIGKKRLRGRIKTCTMKV